MLTVTPSTYRTNPPLSAPVHLEPGVLALELFDHVPAWAIAHAVHDDRSAPLIRKGEIAIVEMAGGTGWLPQRGGLFLIEHGGHPDVNDSDGRRRSRRSWAIIQTREGRGGWYACDYRTGRDLQFRDGPYDLNHLAEKLIGRVVGLYSPSRQGSC